jgi:hypothetical protein
MASTPAARDDVLADPGPAPEPFATEATAASAHLPAGPTGRRWRLFDRLVLTAFIAGLLAPGTIMLAGLRPAAIENRPLVALPPVSAQGLLDASWPARVDAFLADNVYFRPWAVRLRGELVWRSGGSGTPEVVRGKDDWLFIRGEFEPKCLFTGQELGDKLRQAATSFGADGPELRFLLIPDKHSIYPEQVRPDTPFAPSCEDTGRAALTAAIDSLHPIAIDSTPTLRAARASGNTERLFYAGDTHWTPTGAMIAIRPLIESLDPGLWRDDDVVPSGTIRRVTDIAALMGIRRVEPTLGLAVRPGVKLRTQDVSVPVDVQNARTLFRVTADGDRPTHPGRTLVVYDSFFGIYEPLIAPFFADTTWVHVGDMLHHPELASILGPFDTVIFNRGERGIYETDVGSLLAPLAHGARDRP